MSRGRAPRWLFNARKQQLEEQRNETSMIMTIRISNDLCPLLRLPPELRLDIYSYIFEPDEMMVDTRKPFQVVKCLWICSALRADMRPDFCRLLLAYNADLRERNLWWMSRYPSSMDRLVDEVFPNVHKDVQRARALALQIGQGILGPEEIEQFRWTETCPSPITQYLLTRMENERKVAERNTWKAFRERQFKQVRAAARACVSLFRST
jgi:hypothetical protein